MPLVLAENEATESGITYQDRTGSSYQFPKMYSRQMQSGERFVYYKGRKKISGGRAPQVYFGTGIIGTVRADPIEPNRLACDILDYVPFASPLFFKRDQRSYLESGGNRRGYYQRGVRTISEEDFEAILAAANMQASSSSEEAIEDGPLYGTPDSNLEIEQFAVTQAIAELLSRYPGAAIAAQVRNNPGFDILVKDGERLIYVEVKGTRKRMPRFIITQGEVQFSRRNANAYHLLVYYEIDLLRGKCQLWSHAGAIDGDAFRLKPLQWSCEPIGQVV